VDIKNYEIRNKSSAKILNSIYLKSHEKGGNVDEEKE